MTLQVDFLLFSYFHHLDLGLTVQSSSRSFGLCASFYGLELLKLKQLTSARRSGKKPHNAILIVPLNPKH